MQNVQIPHDDALVIHTTVTNFSVKKTLVDTKSVVDILFYHAFKGIKFSMDKFKPCKTTLSSFTGEFVYPAGIIS